MGFLSTLDLLIFFGSILGIMVLGLWAGRKEESSDDYFLAGRSSRWFGVAGSIFGSNVSANHIVGMMGVGFSVGFAQSHFEISAIAGLLLLCYCFLPMYRRLNIYTLSEYLSSRYNDSCRIAYAIIMLIIIVVIQMVPGYYIGSRSLNLLLNKNENASAKPVINDAGQITSFTIIPGRGYSAVPKVVIAAPEKGEAATATAAISEKGEVSEITINTSGSGYDSESLPKVTLVGGVEEGSDAGPGDVLRWHYILGIILMALITGTYTILGGLKAVIVTDVVQSILLLGAGMIVAFVTFSQVDGWDGMVEIDSRPSVEITAADGSIKELKTGRLHLFNASDHPELPWTGVLTGLMVLHCYYWGTNQFIVQRALAARSDSEARFGIIAAGFFKLLIPFFSIGCGIAAYYYFAKEQVEIAPDAVFTRLLTDLISPIGYGLVGIVAAGMVGAILSSLDSMMNSAATILTFDVYKRYVDPKASEQKLITVGRFWIVVFVVGSASLAIFSDPNSKDNFFLTIAQHQSKLVAGVVVAFVLGMLWSRATAAGALAGIIVGIVVSYGLPYLYEWLAQNEDFFLIAVFGTKLNFMHSVFVAAICALLTNIVVSLLTPMPEKQKQLTWVNLELMKRRSIVVFATTLGVSILFFGLLGVCTYLKQVSPIVAATFASVWTFSCFAVSVVRNEMNEGKFDLVRILKNDRLLAGLLAATAMFMMFAFF